MVFFSHWRWQQTIVHGYVSEKRSQYLYYNIYCYRFSFGWCANKVNVMTLMIQVKLLVISPNFGMLFLGKNVDRLNHQHILQYLFETRAHTHTHTKSHNATYTIDLFIIMQTRIKWLKWSIFSLLINFGQFGLILLFHTICSPFFLLFFSQMYAHFSKKYIKLRASKSKNKQNSRINGNINNELNGEIYIRMFVVPQVHGFRANIRELFTCSSNEIMWKKNSNDNNSHWSSHRKWVRVRNSLFIVRAT